MESSSEERSFLMKLKEKNEKGKENTRKRKQHAAKGYASSQRDIIQSRRKDEGHNKERTGIGT